jgi:hypothetical protein
MSGEIEWEAKSYPGFTWPDLVVVPVAIFWGEISLQGITMIQVKIEVSALVTMFASRGLT